MTNYVKSKSIANFPRRSVYDEMTEEEKGIQEIVWGIEKLGCDPLLTEAQLLLLEAKDRLSDYVDKKIADNTK